MEKRIVQLSLAGRAGLAGWMIIFTLAWSARVFAAEGAVFGKITEEITRRPLAGVKVDLNGTSHTTKSDTRGYYLLENIEAGEYQLVAHLPGYQTETINIEVEEGKKQPWHPVLKPAITQPGEGIVIKAKQKPPHQESLPSKETLTPKVIRESSVDLFSDIAETLKTLPAVISPGDFSGELYVRGGQPSETIFVLDRVFIPNPYHWDGRVTTFNTKLIDKVDFYAGGLPAETGNVLAGVVDISYKKGSREQFAGSLETSVTTLDLQLECPLLKNQASWLFSAKRTNYDLVLNMLDQKDQLYPFFHEVFAKVYYEPAPGHQISLYHLFSGEGLDLVAEDEDEEDKVPGLPEERFKWDGTQNISSLNYKWLISPELSSETTLSHLWGDGNYHEYSLTEPFDVNFASCDYSFRQDFTCYLGKRHKLRAGTYIYWGDADLYVYEKEESGQEDVTDFDERNRYTGYYLWDKWQLMPKLLTCDFGVRYERLDLANDSVFTPRISLSLALGDKMTLKAACGYNSQFGVDAYQYDKSPGLKAQRGLDHVMGMERKLSEDVRLRIEAYYKDFRHLIIQDGEDSYSNDGQGFSKGLEFFLQKKEGGRLDGWISYALSKSKRRYGYFDWGKGIIPYYDPTLYPTNQDRRHTISVVANYKLSDKWRLGMKWRCDSGNPRTPFHKLSRQIQEEGEIKIPQGFIRSERMPWYHRIDVRFSRDFKLWNLDHSFYFEVINLYNRKNLYGYYYDEDDYYSEPEEAVMFGILPVAGIETKF
ncbi:MAG: TonB-dependent receptor [bacterium]|nr:TonB-dependent receptor [bacterium]